MPWHELTNQLVGFAAGAVFVLYMAYTMGWLTLPEWPHRKSQKKTHSKECLVCGHGGFRITAEGGGGQNAVCRKCGSLHLNSPFGLELLRAGTPAPKVILPSGEKIECETGTDALTECAAWNREHHPRGGTGDPGAYVIDSEGVMATDPLAPYGC